MLPALHLTLTLQVSLKGCRNSSRVRRGASPLGSMGVMVILGTWGCRDGEGPVGLLGGERQIAFVCSIARQFGNTSH